MRQLDHPGPDAICLTGVLAALSDPARLAIVASLRQAGCECGSTGFDIGLAGSTLSHHLKVLREAGVVQHRKEGTRCFVTLRPDLETVLPGLLDTVLRLVPQGCQPAVESTSAGSTADHQGGVDSIRL